MNAEPADRAWADARRVLCVRLDNLGDVLMTTPALRALKQAQPQRHLCLLASRGGAAAARHIPEVDQVLSYEAPWTRSLADAAADRALIEQLRAQAFDAAVIFTVFSQSALPAALLCHLAGIPLRLAHCRENPYSLLSHWVEESEPQRQVRHEVQRQLDLVATVGARTDDLRLSFRVEPDDRRSLEARLLRLGIGPGQPLVLIHPGASAESRRYPPERYAVAAWLVHQRLRCPLLFGGSADERELVGRVRRELDAPSHSLAGELSLGECAALIERATVLVSNNSGPVHLAAALGASVVDLYAQTNLQHTPWQVPHKVLWHDVPCKWCFKSRCPQGHHDCLRKVEPEEVAQAAIELFERRTGQAPPSALEPASPADGRASLVGLLTEAA